MLHELPKRIQDWMPRLATEGIVGADAIFSCLGPALEIFSRHSRVEKASGEQVTLKEYLEHVWAAVAKEALNMIFEGADATGFEEDARLTAMWLWTVKTDITEGISSKPETNSFDNDSGSNESETEANLDEETSITGKTIKTTGFVLEYDAARKIAQALGAHLEHLTGVVEVKGDKARLISVSERARFLFSDAETQKTAGRRKKKEKQQIFAFMEELEEVEDQSGRGVKGAPKLGKTTLDRLHQCMILFGAGRGEALKRYLVEEGIGRDQRFWRLAQSLSALYPANTDEKRWVDGLLARKKGLGF